MKLKLIPLLLSLLVTLTLSGCNNAPKPKSIENSAHQQAHNHSSFPRSSHAHDTVVCQNCHATFKLSQATQKQSHGHSYLTCPICHRNYLKKANN